MRDVRWRVCTSCLTHEFSGITATDAMGFSPSARPTVHPGPTAAGGGEKLTTD